MCFRGIAASAPIVQFQGLTPCSKYGQIVSADFQRVSNNCSWTIRKSWDIINSFGKTGKEILQILNLISLVIISCRGWKESDFQSI
jgi:hypothetical protein